MKKIEFMGAELTTLQYTGRKTVEAVPMKRSDAEMEIAIAHNIVDMTADMPEEDAEGYLVIYPDGYRSWSPKDVFEEAYMVSETYDDRLLIEVRELGEKIAKAANYLKNHNSPLVCRQLKHMLDYKAVLDERIGMHQIFDKMRAELKDGEPEAEEKQEAEGEPEADEKQEGEGQAEGEPETDKKQECEPEAEEKQVAECCEGPGMAEEGQNPKE